VVVGPDLGICNPAVSTADLSTSVEPEAPLTLQGQFLGTATVRVDGQLVASLSSADGTTLTFVPPAHLAGVAPLSIVTPNGRVDTSITYAWRRSAGRTLTVDGSLADWSKYQVAASSSVPPDWSAEDVLRGLYLAYDADGLWIGVDGRTATSPANGLLVYIDTGPASTLKFGVADLSLLADANSALSDACASGIQVVYPGYHADVCAGSVGMASVAKGAGLPATGLAGARYLWPSYQFSWLLDASGGSQAVVATSPLPGSVELFLPWATLGLSPRPPALSHITLFVRIVSPNGSAASSQSLPSDGPPPVVNAAIPVVFYW
jgi:hypothetical protein